MRRTMTLDAVVKAILKGNDITQQEISKTIEILLSECEPKTFMTVWTMVKKEVDYERCPV